MISVGKYILMFLLLLQSSAAFAYRAARISADQAEVKDAPNGNTQTTLPSGTRVNTSDQSTDGYYRVRSSNASGWVQEGDLEFIGSSSRRERRQAPERMEDPRDSDQSQPSSSSNDYHTWVIKLFGGLDFFNPSQLDSVIGSNALQTGIGFGGELDIALSKHVFVGLRVEDLSKTATGPDANGNQFQFSLSSVPVMAGFMFQLANGSDFTWDLGIYGGMGLSTSISGTETSAAAPNVTTASTTAPTFLINTDVDWHITDPFWIFLEVGYRYLNTSNVTPSSGSNGQSIFETTGTNPTFIPFQINLSGPVVNIGGRINF
jgi:opacity protein-like surface antigen